MATQTLAVDLAARHISAAASVSTLRTLKLDGWVAAPTEDADVSELLAARRWDRVVATLPAGAAFFRFLDLPFRDRRRLAQAVGPMIEEHVPLSLDEAVTAFDFAGPGKTSAVLAAMTRHTAIEERMAELAELGISAGLLVWQPSAAIAAYRAAIGADSEALLVDVGIDCTLVAYVTAAGLQGLRIVSTLGDPGFVRDLRWAARTLEASLDRVVVGGALFESARDRVKESLEDAAVELLPEECPLAGGEHAYGSWRAMPAAMGLALIVAGEAEAPVLSFAPGGASLEEAADRRSAILRSLAPWAAASFVLFAAAVGVDYVRLYRASSHLEKTADRLFKAAMPGVAGGAGRKTKLELRLQELEAKRAEAAGGAREDSALGVLVTLSQAVPADLEVEFETYAYDPPNIRMRGHATTFEAVTQLQEMLRSSTSIGAVDVGDVRSSATGGGVDFELTIRMGERS